MKFLRADPAEHYRSLRLLSQQGKWELGMSIFSHGMRMRMGRAGKPPAVIDFCMGLNSEIYSTVLLAILQKLEPIAEDQPAEVIDATFPWKRSRPDLSIHLEPLLSEVQSDLSP